MAANEANRTLLPQGETAETREMHGATPNNVESGNVKGLPVTVSQVPFPQFGKLANPGPLGLLGFAVTTLVLGLYQCGAGFVSVLSFTYIYLFSRLHFSYNFTITSFPFYPLPNYRHRAR